MKTTTSRQAEQVLYVQAGNGTWVYWGEHRTEEDARYAALELTARGKRVLVCDSYRGPTVER